MEELGGRMTYTQPEVVQVDSTMEGADRLCRCTSPSVRAGGRRQAVKFEKKRVKADG